MNRSPSRRFLSGAITDRSPLGRRRRASRLVPWAESLEDRTVLSAISWDATHYPTGGDWNTPGNWVGGVVPSVNDTVTINLTSPGQVYMTADNFARGITTNSNTTLDVDGGTLALGISGSSTFGGSVVVQSGATLKAALGASLTIADGHALTDNGTVNLALGDTVTFTANIYGQGGGRIAVAGTFNAVGTNFNNSGGNVGTIAVAAGGHLLANTSSFSVASLTLDSASVLNAGDLAGDTFNLPLSLPYNFVPNLAGNASFRDVDINAGNLGAGAALALNAVGTNTAGLRYVLAGNLGVAAGATLSVGPGVPVLIPDGVTLADNGIVNFAAGDTVTFSANIYGQGGGRIAVAGALNAVGTTFNNTGGNVGTIGVGAGGHLTAANSTFGMNSLSLDSASVLNAGDLVGDSFNLPVSLPYAFVADLAGNASFRDVDINAGNLGAGAALALNAVGTNTAGLRYVLAGSLGVAAGATLSVGPGVPVLIPDGVTLTDNGIVNFAAGDTVTFSANIYGQGGGRIAVAPGGAGTLNAAGTTFNNSGGNVGTIGVGAGGHLTAANSTFGMAALTLDSASVLNAGDLAGDTFNLPLSLPYAFVADLAGNASFRDVDINAGNLGGGTLALNAVGTNTAGLRYVLAGNLGVAAGATLSVGPGVPVLIPDGVTLTDNGIVNFAAGDTVTFSANIYGQGGGRIAVAPGGAGTLNAAGTTFNNSGGNVGTIGVGAGGHLTATASTFSLPSLSLNSGSNDTLNFDVFTNQLAINAGATINITGNDFSNANARVVASGDPSATIRLPRNYWGTSVPSQIDAKITGSTQTNPNANLPTVNYDPIVTGPGAVVAQSVGPVAFSAVGRNVTLQAVVTATSGNTVKEGTVTFTVLSGAAILGTPVTSDPLTNGSASVSYALPPGTPVGTYTIQAVYTDPGGSLLDEIDTAHSLTVGTAPTSVAALPASATYSASSGQQVPLSATVTSGAGTVAGGTVTFTILNGATPVGSQVVATVAGGSAGGTYTLPPGSLALGYTISAVYSGFGNFAGTSDSTHHLAVGAATTAVVGGDASAYFSPTGLQVPLSATVSSPAGAVKEGYVTFDILNGPTTIASVNSGTVSNGVATANYVPPSPLAAGAYTIRAFFNGSTDFAASADASAHALTVGPATTLATLTNPAPAAFSPSAQAINLAAAVTYGSAPLGVGTVTFAIFNGATPIGTPAAGTLNAAGMAGAAYQLTAATPPGSYTIKAVYSDPGDGDYAGSTAVGTLVVGKSGQTLAIAGAPATAVFGSTFHVTAASDSGLPITLVGTNCTVVASAGGGYDVTMGTGTGTATLTASQAGNADYNSQVTSTTIAARQAAANVTLSGLAATYTGSALSPSASTSIPDLAVTFTYTDAQTHAVVANPSAPGTYDVTATINDANYRGSSQDTLTIARAVTTATIPPSAQMLVYDGSPESVTATTGVPVQGVTYDYYDATGHLVENSLNQAVPPTVAGPYTVVVTINDADYQGQYSYPLTIARVSTAFGGLSASQSITFGRATVTVSGTLTATPAVPAGESIAITIGSATGTARLAADGSFRATVDVSGLSASTTPYPIHLSYNGDGSDPNFLAKVDASTTLTITQASQSITFVAPPGHAFGDPSFPLAGYASATSGLAVTFLVAGPASLSGGSIQITGVGQVTVTAMQSGNLDYAPATQVVRTFAVSAAPTAIKLSSDTFVYDGLPHAPVGGVVEDAAGANVGSPSYAYYLGLPSAGTPLSAPPVAPGTYTVLATFAATGTYAAATQASATLVIQPRTIVVTVDADQSRTYGDPDPTLTYTDSLAQLPPGDGLAGQLQATPGVAAAAGTYPVGVGSLRVVNLATAQPDPDYQLALAGNPQFTVTPRPITIVADAGQSKVYGQPDPALTFSIPSGNLVNGDKATLVRAVGETVNGGPYLIGLAALGSNYAVNYISASFTINPAPLAVAANSVSTTYGQGIPALTAIPSGPIFTGSLATTAGDRPGAGSYPITQGTLSAGPNYTIQFTPGTLTVNPAPLTINVAGTSKVYGAAVPTLTFAAGGLVNGDTLKSLASLHLATKATKSSRVGNYAITTTGSVGPNYTLVKLVTGTLKVTPAPLTITALAQKKAFGAAVPRLTYAVKGFVNGDTVRSFTHAPKLATKATKSSPAGKYAISISGATDPNYTIRYVAGTLTVLPKH